MRETRGQLDLEKKAFGADLGGDFGAENLEGHLPVVAKVVGQEDDRHSAFPELATDRVAAGERRSET